MPTDKAHAVGSIISGVVDTWAVEDIVRLLRIIPQSSYYSLADGKERMSSDKWSSEDLGALRRSWERGAAG